MPLSSLLRAILEGEAGTGREELEREMSAASQRAWRETLDGLRCHRLEPLAWHRLKLLGLARALPPEASAQLEASHLRCFVENGRRMNALDLVLDAWSKRALEPVLLKGAALVNSIYPGLGTRPMGDVDVFVAPEQLAEALAALRELGFEQKTEQADTLGMVKDSFLTLDLHHRLRIFDGQSVGELSLPARPRYLVSRTVRILAPNATVVHLVAHLEGHRSETGYVLGWLVDLALALRAWGAAISPRELRRLARDEDAYRAILAALDFVQRELGVRLPAELALEARAENSLTLDRALSSRRRALWGLPGPLGWIRLASHCSGLKRYPARPLPKWTDLWSLGSDLRDRRAAGPATSRRSPPPPPGPPPR